MDFLFEFQVAIRGEMRQDEEQGATRVASSFGFELSHKLVRHRNDKLQRRREREGDRHTVANDASQAQREKESERAQK